MIDLKINVSGKVQGVWFRAKTKEKADELGVFGFVQNENDGSVYIEVSGETNTVYKFIQWLQIGSELSDVDQVCIEVNTAKHQRNFLINR